jgi:FtsZ-interacting cell division protein ZipA
MKYLLGSVAIATLIVAGLPASAQSNTSDQSTTSTQSSTSNQAGTSNQSTQSVQPTAGNAKHAAKQTAERPRHAKSQTRVTRSSDDNMAEELNRKELERLSQNNNQGSSQMPAGGQSGTSGTNGTR